MPRRCMKRYVCVADQTHTCPLPLCLIGCLSSALQVLAVAPSSGFAKVHYGFILKSENKIAESIPYLKVRGKTFGQCSVLSIRWTCDTRLQKPGLVRNPTVTWSLTFVTNNTVPLCVSRRVWSQMNQGRMTGVSISTWGTPCRGSETAA